MAETMRVDLHGLDRRLLRAARQLEDYKTPLRRSETFMEKSIGKRFRTAAWRPLSAKTLQWHPHRVGGKPLNDTGALKMSIESGAANKLSKKKLRIRSGLKKANLHQHGGWTKLGTYVPSRKFLYFDEFDKRMVERIFVDYIEEVADGVDPHQV